MQGEMVAARSSLLPGARPCAAFGASKEEGDQKGTRIVQTMHVATCRA